MRKSINIILKKNILIILLMISMCPVIGFSYARFVINTDSYRSNEMYMAELLYTVKIDDISTYTLTLEAGAYEEEHIIEITSLNAVSTNYKLIYQNNSNVKIEYASDYQDPTFGGILTKRIIMLRLTNNSEEDQTLSFSVVGGYSFNSLDEIDIPSGYSEINLEYWKYDYETMALYVNNTRVDELDSNKYYELENYTCNNVENITYDKITKGINIYPISKQAKCSFYFTETSNPVFSYDYNSNNEFYTFEVPKTGYYKLEVWGAQGGGDGGKGGYSKGEIVLNKGEALYIYVGSEGSKYIGGYNGGGKGQGSGTTNDGYGGGGATHIAKKNGILSTLSANKEQVLIVGGAGGGSGLIISRSGGNAGGYLGNNGTGTCFIGKGGTQTGGGECGESGYSTNGGFGYGGNSHTSTSVESAGGGGSGYYGGGGNSYSSSAGCTGGGAGGSSYIGNPLLEKKVMYCYNCDTNTYVSEKTISNTCAQESPTENCSKLGNGYAKITYLKELDINDNINDIQIGESKSFVARGIEDTFKVPKSGNYRLEVWGAQGGGNGGKGGYSSGIITLSKDEILYIYVGIMGQQNIGGFNGGGKGQGSGAANDGYGGGGATHISKEYGELSSLSKKVDSILIVAGGGGGSGLIKYRSGGNAGGYIGNDGTGTCYAAKGGTQTSGGACGESGYSTNGGFGYGGNGHTSPSTESAGGGGSGYYGGGGSSYSSSAGCTGGGAGGSSYIGNSLLKEKVMYCYDCSTSSDESTKTISNTCAKELPTENCSKLGNGYAKITYLGAST